MSEAGGRLLSILRPGLKPEHGTIVIIPAFNERANIAAVIERVRECLAEADVVVVDDGSRDETAAIAKRLGAVVLRHPFNMGYGVALQTGYKYALAGGYGRAVQIDGDGQHDPAYIKDLLRELDNGKCDIVIGSRFLFTSKYRQPFLKKVGSRLFAFLASFIISQKLTDTTSGFQALNREAMKYVSTDLYPDDYPDANFLIMLQKAGYRIAEVPVQMYMGGEKSMHSGLKPIYYIFKVFLSIFVTLLNKK